MDVNFFRFFELNVKKMLFFQSDIKFTGKGGSFDTHIAMVWWYLWQMPYVMNCHKMSFYDILWHMAFVININIPWQYGYQKNRLG